MEYKKLAGTGLKVSRICLGTMTFGGQTPEDKAVEMVRYAIENGVNFIDTADIYPDAGGRTGGASEVAVGKGIAGYRDQIVLATKIRYPMGLGINDRGLTRSHIIRGVEESLRRLNTDYIDIYYMHLPDNDTPIEESLYAMNDLVRSGKVRYIGISNFASWQISDALAVADKRNIIAPIITQNVYNLLTRSIENELVPCIQRHDISLTVYNPICGGLLTGKHRIVGGPTKNTRFADDKDYVARYWNEANFQAVTRLTEIAQEAGISLIELAMRWIASHDFVTALISGCSKMEQLEQNIPLLDNGPLSIDVMAMCDEVWKNLAGGQFLYTAQRQV